MVRKLELLAPAGTPQTLKAVIDAGADAVYIGGEQFSARAYAPNFNREELLWAVDYAHLHGRKLFLAVNTLLKEEELEGQLYEYLLPCYEQGLDAVIVQDFGVMQFVRRNFGKMPIHASTQMTVLSEHGADFLAKAGASRIVMARELSLEEIDQIHRNVPVEIEAFVHGAICYCYSGQCLFSSMLGGRSGNRGRCAQPCRLSYEVLENEKSLLGKGQAYPLSPKDLCTIELLPQLAESGVYSFKIEGRMKQAEYAKGVVSVYRKYMDRYLNFGKEGYLVSKEDQQKLFDFGSRSGFTEGCFNKQSGPDMITFQKPNHKKTDSGEAADAQPERKLKINGCMKVKAGQPTELTAEYRGCKISVTGEMAVPASTRPLTEEALRARINKTGNTPFEFAALDIDIEEGLFLPAASINELRRHALDVLQEQYLSPYRRRAGAAEINDFKSLASRRESPIQKQADETFFITASAETKEQISVLLENPYVSEIYVDSGVFSRNDTVSGMQEIFGRAKEAKKQVYYILPLIFRSHTAVFYASVLPRLCADGFLVKNYDALGFLLKRGIEPERIRTDYNLNTWSKESRDAFFAYHISGDTVPAELNRKEIAKRENTKSEMLIYGHLPLMVSAHCLVRNLKGCSHTPGVLNLKDRYDIMFPVKNHCGECYNIIYNSRPLSLFSAADELKSFGITRFRFSFTTESKEQARQILKLGGRMILEKRGDREELQRALSGEFTYGHYKRGVE